MAERAVFDAGPLIHLEEVDQLNILLVIDQIVITEEISKEIGEDITSKVDLNIKRLDGETKDKSKYIVERHGLDLGESTGIALSRQENIKLFFTDDLEARKKAKKYDLEPHGTLALVTRAYREDIIKRSEAINTVEKLYEDSTLYITKDLVSWTKERIKKHHD